jgi:nitrate reductase alpha subunit
MSWIQDLFAPEQRNWEDFYRNRWRTTSVVRSTHGVNCTADAPGTSTSSRDRDLGDAGPRLPAVRPEYPAYEPRGCQRGISYSWYIYSPLRVKYPYIRGALLDLWREALGEASWRPRRGVGSGSG